MGFTIGFDGREIFNLSKSENATFGFCRVEYDRSRQEEAIQLIINEMDDMIEKFIPNQKSDNRSKIHQMAIAYDHIISSRSARSKHQSFRGEKEWRLISYVSEDDKEFEDVRFRVSSMTLVPYIVLSIGSVPERLPIKSIGIGPGFSGIEQIKAVKALCEKTKYRPDIYFADTPYRRP